MNNQLFYVICRNGHVEDWVSKHDDRAEAVAEALRLSEAEPAIFLVAECHGIAGNTLYLVIAGETYVRKYADIVIYGH